MFRQRELSGSARFSDQEIAMFLIHGSYRFWPKLVGFRNDYCLTCRAPRRSIAIRTFDVGHIFWIPILPVGFWKHWQCSNCGKDPHKTTKTRRSFKWIGLFLLIVLAVMSWVEPVAPPDEWLGWIFRIGCPVLAMLLFANLMRASKELSLSQALKSVEPASDTTCPLCSTPLLAGPRWSCPGCRVSRY
jgi:hypothetical protein